MRVLVGILGCHTRQLHRHYQRQSCLRKLNCDHRYFIGFGNTKLADDEIQLEVPDDYKSLLLKTRGMVKHALDFGYDYLFKCDDDTYLVASRLRHPDHDYVGRMLPLDGLGTHFAGGGGGYWLSRKAMKILVDSSEDRQYRTRAQQLDGAKVLLTEDHWVGKILKDSGVSAMSDPRYADVRDGVVPSNVIAVCEYPKAEMLRAEQLYGH